MVTEYQQNKIKRELGLSEETKPEQVCIVIDKKRSEIRMEINDIRKEIGELDFDPFKMVYVSDSEFREKTSALKLQRHRYKSLLEKLNDLNLDERFMKCEK